jgi:HK97 gp10 family phage protein
MSDASGIKVKGLRELNRSLTAIGVPRAEMNAAAKASAEKVLLEAKALTPVRTGALRSTIRISSTAKGMSIKAGNEGKVPYANPIHWGWFKRHIKPQPFLAKALGYTRQEIFDNYFRAIDGVIAKQRSGSQVK